MLAEERKQRILELVNERRIVKVTELSQLLSATEATVRRDLEDLQHRKKLCRIHGGAAAINQTSRMIAQKQLIGLCAAEKKTIAQEAYSFLEDYDAILLDGSTTVLEMVKLIAAGKLAGLSIITNSFVVVQALSSRDDLKVIHTGGQVMNVLDSTFGVVAERMVRNVKVEKCFVGTNGIDPNYGYSSPTFEEASLKKAMIEASRTRYVLADSTKYGASYMGKFAEFKGDIDYLLSDAPPPDEDLPAYRSSVQLVIAPLNEQAAFSEES